MLCIKRNYLLIQLVKYEFYDNIIFESQDLGDSLSNPGFDDLQVYFGHVHLKDKKINKQSSNRLGHNQLFCLLIF